MKEELTTEGIKATGANADKRTYITVDEDCYGGCKAYWSYFDNKLESGDNGGKMGNSLHDEWSSNEVIDEIELQLSYDTYIEIDDIIYPVEDSVEEFLEEYRYENDYDDDYYDDDIDYTELLPCEAAEKLADDIEFL